MVIVVTLALLLSICVKINAFSFTANGEWVQSSNDSVECSHFTCTENRLKWQPNYDAKFYNNVTGCEALINKGIKKMVFFGDSFMRQIYAGLLITLKGDFRYGSQADPSRTPECEYQRQFWEKRCGTHQLDHQGKVCGGKIWLDPLLHDFHHTNLCLGNGTVALWSVANYKLFGLGRYTEHCGVNNATMYQQSFEQTNICPLMRQNQEVFTGDVTKECSVWWVSTHYRVKGHFHDEYPEKIKQYNEDMRAYFDSPKKNCGNVNYIDVYNMTTRLTVDHPEEAAKLTYDMVHWGMEVNLVKAQIILNALIQS